MIYVKTLETYFQVPKNKEPYKFATIEDFDKVAVEDILLHDDINYGCDEEVVEKFILEYEMLGCDELYEIMKAKFLSLEAKLKLIKLDQVDVELINEALREQATYLADNCIDD